VARSPELDRDLARHRHDDGAPPVFGVAVSVRVPFLGERALEHDRVSAVAGGADTGPV